MRLLGAKAKPAADHGVRLAPKPGTNQVGEHALKPLQAPLDTSFRSCSSSRELAIVVAAVHEGLAIGQRRRMLLAAQVDDRVTGDLVQPGPEVLALKFLWQATQPAARSPGAGHRNRSNERATR